MKFRLSLELHVTRHKPDEVAERIESLYPSASKLEMFARTTRPGWDVFGNETDKF